MLLRFFQQRPVRKSIIPILSVVRTRLISTVDMSDSSIKTLPSEKRLRTTETTTTTSSVAQKSDSQRTKKHGGRRKRKIPTIEPFSGDDILRREVISLLQRQRAVVVVGEDEGDFEEEEEDLLSSPPIETGTEVQLVVSELSSSGDSLSVLPEPYKPWVVAVPFALPGERITARVYRHGKGISFGDLVRVEEPNGELRDMSRVQCKYFGKCAGCQYQMLSYEEQLLFKQSVVKRAYANYSGLVPEVVPEILSTIPSPQQYGYRTKITPHFDIPPKRFRKENDENRTWEIRIGFGEKGRRSVMDIEECPIATPVLNAALPSIRADVRSRFDTYKKGATLLLRDSVSDQDPGHVCVTEYHKTVRERVGKHVFEFPAGSFFQNNSSILEPLTSYVRDAMLKSQPELKYLVDAYCGSGLFSITLWEGFSQVVGIEISKESIESARHNGVLNDIPESRCRFYAGEAERIFDIDMGEGMMMKTLFPAELTAVIIDPPRKGCDRVFLEQLVKFGPGKMVYVSCNVHTQARDLGMIFEMTKGGYEIESIRGFDLFPQTSHVESVAVLRRKY